ncbi:374_t:CDS:1 [Gigaspora rosea]|nr:374_t:CDS:1 [Gigaspora rosea]
MNWYEYAQNEEFTVTFLYGASPNDPINLYWQWTKDAAGEIKGNVLYQTTITSVTQTGIPGEVKFNCTDNNYYKFDITSKQYGGQLSIFMRNTAGDTSSEMILQKYYPSQPQIYVGKLNWYDFAVNELFVVVFPSGIGEDLPVTAHWQWTKNSSGESKVNRDLTDKQHKNSQDPQMFYFGDGYYTFNCTADDKNKTLAVTMSNPSGDSFGTVTLQLQQSN